MAARFFRSLNSIVAPLVRHGVGSPPPIGLGLVAMESTGHASGLTREVPLVGVRLGDRVVSATVRSRSHWLRNLEADGESGVWLCGRRRDADATVVRGPLSIASFQLRWSLVTRLSVMRGDITVMAVDAIVNAANSGLIGGGGVDGAIHRAGGPTILEECRAIVAAQGGCPPGEAVITSAGAMAASHVIHTVGPIWGGGDPDGDDATLASCYVASLTLAAAHDLRTIAFPNISTGIYGFPKDRAAGVAVGAVRSWVAAHSGAIDKVTFVCFDDENEGLYNARL